jgi:hypothetical protein
MRISLLLSLLILIAILPEASAGPGDVIWTRNYGGVGAEQAYFVQQTSDGGYIIAGSTSSYGTGLLDVYLVKTDADGYVEWSRTFGGTDYDWAECVRQTSDGGYIVVGLTMSYGAGFFDAYMIKTDADGEEEWTRTFGDILYDGAYSVEQTGDGGYVLTGFTVSYITGTSDVWLIRTDSNGDTLWTRTYGGELDEGGNSVLRTYRGDLAIAGYTSSFGAGYDDVYLIRTDSNGDTMFTRTYGEGDSSDAANCVAQASGGYILAGYTQRFGPPWQDAYLIRTDTYGQAQWIRNYGGWNDDCAESVIEGNYGGFVVAGWTTSFGAGSSDIWLLRIDADGDTLWTRTFGGPDRDFAYCIDRTSEGDYILAGWTENFGALGSDFYLVKVEGDGPIGVDDDIQSPNDYSLGKNYPNPFNSSTVIPIGLGAPGHATLKVYNIAGQCVATPSDGFLEEGRHDITFDASDYASGIYFYRLTAGGRAFTRRMLILK